MVELFQHKIPFSYSIHIELSLIGKLGIFFPFFFSFSVLLSFLRNEHHHFNRNNKVIILLKNDSFTYKLEIAEAKNPDLLGFCRNLPFPQLSIFKHHIKEMGQRICLVAEDLFCLTSSFCIS